MWVHEYGQRSTGGSPRPPRVARHLQSLRRLLARHLDIEPLTLSQRGPWLAQFGATGRHRLFVAERAGEIIGYAGTHWFRPKQAYETTAETTIYCAPQARGAGVGRALYTVLFEALRSEDIRVFMAGITLPNAASIRLHERFGFGLCGTMHAVGRKFNQYWDVGWYEKVLPTR